MDLQGCRWSLPDENCLRHHLDVIVFCADATNIVNTKDGFLRLMSNDGAPSLDGVGRLDILQAGDWSPACAEGFTAGAADVACKQMGFAAASTGSLSSTCAVAESRSYCSKTAPRVSGVSCTGQ